MKTKTQNEAPWDIALYKNVEEMDEKQLPHMIDVSVSYTPIHDFLPKKGTNDVFYILGKDDSWITELPPMEGWGNENLENEKELSRKEQRKQKREERRAERGFDRQVRREQRAENRLNRQTQREFNRNPTNSLRNLD